MKIAILLYGYSYATRYRTYEISGQSHAIKDATEFFELSKENFEKNFLNRGYDIFVHAWDTDYFRDAYINFLNPVEYKISSQEECKDIMCGDDSNTEWYDIGWIGPRIYQMNILSKMIRDRTYDIVMLRRFDLIFKNEFLFDNLNPNNVHLVLDYTDSGKIYNDKFFTIFRLNDYQITSSQSNMDRYLSATKSDRMEYSKSLEFTNQKQQDHHHFVYEHLKKLNLLKNTIYFLDHPYDVVLTKSYNNRSHLTKTSKLPHNISYQSVRDHILSGKNI